MFETKMANKQLGSWLKKFKKFLTNVDEYDKLNELFLTATNKKNLDN